jgi:hypothetical protein
VAKIGGIKRDASDRAGAGRILSNVIIIQQQAAIGIYFTILKAVSA